jgi:inosine-uridine nucleoside N-ribohydrolase
MILMLLVSALLILECYSEETLKSCDHKMACRESWIIDTDAGVDDCQALVLALTHEIDIKAITTVAGNIPLPQVNKNVGETLRVCGREEIPIFSGAGTPFVRDPDYAMGALIHGTDGLNGYWEKFPGHNPTLR